MMRTILPMLMVVAGLSVGAVAVADDELTLSLPPSSLEQWYKPANKRQVWLHNMFKMRRAMQAVSEYSALGDQQHLRQWAGKLVKSYGKIGDMVPEWQDELELEWAERLLAAVEDMDTGEIGRTQRRLAKSCDCCHREFRATTALLYRTPDYGSLVVEDSAAAEPVAYKDYMQRLSHSLNSIKIAFGDGRPDAALQAHQQLAGQLEDLGRGCADCHKGPQQRDLILSAEMQATMDTLARAIEQGQVKNGMKELGGLAVGICARCHAIHRVNAGMRELIAP